MLALQKKIEAHLSASFGAEVKVLALVPLAGGACQANLRVDVDVRSADGAVQRRMALRSDAATSLPGSLGRREEFSILDKVVSAGVKTPAARFLARDLMRDGAYAYFMDWAEGDAIGRRVVRDERLAAAREGLAAELAVELAKIHAITPQNSGLSEMVVPPADGDGAAFAIRHTRTMIDTLPEPRPSLELALDWLIEHKPGRGELVLVHGDFRTGNFMVMPEGLSAILDWEFAHFGDREEDLAWIAMRNWRFGQKGKPVGGFATRQELYAAYEKASGKKVDLTRVHWWDVLGNVRWAAGCIHQGERYLRGEQDIELIAIPHHAMEMEYEALRLIEQDAQKGV